jgi:hypothetical protein
MSTAAVLLNFALSPRGELGPGSCAIEVDNRDEGPQATEHPPQSDTGSPEDHEANRLVYEPEDSGEAEKRASIRRQNL